MREANTIAQGTRVEDTDNSLRVSSLALTLLEDDFDRRMSLPTGGEPRVHGHG